MDKAISSEGTTYTAVEDDNRSELVKTIYIDLIDASTIADLPSVKGLVPNVYFVGHRGKEGLDDEETSIYNDTEARDVIAATFYLFQGYTRPGQLAILSPYHAQVKRIRKLFEQVKVPIFRKANTKQEEEEDFWNVYCDGEVEEPDCDFFSKDRDQEISEMVPLSNTHFKTPSRFGYSLASPDPRKEPWECR
ncbi:hypothetical protein BG000_000641 [Podila horticola]|nr:hypothetical protein BG000_000641 [Podila horticola]